MRRIIIAIATAFTFSCVPGHPPGQAPELATTPAEGLEGRLISQPVTDQLEFRILLPSNQLTMDNGQWTAKTASPPFSILNSQFSIDFRTQALDLTQIKYLRIWVRGRGISDRLWNKEGFAKVEGNLNTTLTVAGIPKGENRIVSAQGYDENKQAIPGVLLKAFYSSPPQGESVTVVLKWRFVPVAEALEYLLEQGTGYPTGFSQS